MQIANLWVFCISRCCNAHEHAARDFMVVEATQASGFASPSEWFVCPICHLVLKDPKLTECGHQFCTGCLSICFGGQAFSCPVCRTKLDSSKLFPNNALKRQILDLKITCGRQEDGCEWTGELRNEEDHEEECQYANEYCTNECGQWVMRKDMEDHVDNQCPRRSVYCEHCYLELELMELQDHYEICEMYPVECVYDCGDVLERHKMDSHIDQQGSCPNTPVACDFKNSGCEFRGKRSDLSKHIESNVVSHLGLVAKKLTTTTEELEKTDLELEATKKRLAEAEDKLADMELQHYEELNQRFLSLPPDRPKKFIHIWRIENWSQKVLAAKRKRNPVKEINSDPFYVYPGYHLYICACPNGDRDTAMSCLSIFLTAIEGKFDKKLEWPFPYSFDLEVIDQQSNGNDISIQVSPPYESALQYHTDDCGLGSPEMARHSILGTRCYIKDDTILIRLTVHVKNNQ